MYVMNKNAVLVSRASHTQNVPHVNRPQRLPVTSEIATNNTPISAEAPAKRSQMRERERLLTYTAEHNAVSPKAKYATQIDGTCTYIIRTVLPCTTSSAEKINPLSTRKITAIAVAIPNFCVVGVAVL